jgi:hypothetical protein
VRAGIAALAAILVLPAARAQLPPPAGAELGAEAHIFSAFTTLVDPRAFAEHVVLGPRLRAELGEASGAQVYASLVERTSGTRLRSRRLRPDEVAKVASLPGIRTAEPIVLLQGGDVLLLLQYATQQQNVAFVEQLQGPSPKLAVDVPKPPPPPVIEVAPVPPPAPVVEVAPAVETPRPPPPIVVKKAQPAPAPPAPAPALLAPAPRAEKRRPSGPCVIRPVMSDDDLYNCGATPR